MAIDTTAKPSCGTCDKFMRSPTSKQWGACMIADDRKFVPIKQDTAKFFSQHYSNGGPRCVGYHERSAKDIAEIRALDGVI